MTKIKYDITIMKYISLFESLTGANIKDCIVNSYVTFIVHENQIARAIGRNGVNAKRIEGLINRKIKIVEFNPNVIKFVRNYIFPLKIKDVKEEDGIITIIGSDIRTKGLLIGRDSKNLKQLVSVIKRYFPIKDIKIM